MTVSARDSATPAANPRAALLGRLYRDRWAMGALAVVVTLLSASLAAEVLPLADPAQPALDRRLLPPLSAGHVLGTDQLGRDMLSRLVFGTRLSLLVATIGVAVAASVGSVIGVVAAYFGRLVDGILMRSVDVLMAFPYLLLALAIVAVLGPGLVNATLAIACVNVPFFARTVRGQALSIQREAFVDAARVSGLGSARIVFGEVLPNLLPILVVSISTSLGWMILETAGLSFLGLGAQPPTADLGGMLGQARHLLGTHPHVCLLPGLLIFVLVVALNLLGDALRDAIDPRSAKSPGQVTARAPTTQRLAAPSERVQPSEACRTLLCVDGLQIGFGGRMAVHDISFELSRGEKLGLVGESGSGKSLTALALLDLLDQGQLAARSLCFDGRELLVEPRAYWHSLRGRHIAWIPQDPMTSLHPLYRIGQQLEPLILLHRGVRGEAATEIAIELLSAVGLADPRRVLRAFPHELSGGMRQRVAIALALSGEPTLLLADEPTTALDVTTQAQVLARLRALCDERGAALLFISHDLAVVSQLCDRVLVMHRGQIVERAATERLLAEPVHDYTRRLLEAVPELGRPEKILYPTKAEGGVRAPAPSANEEA